MTTPRYATHWEVSGYDPDRPENYNLCIRFVATEKEALALKAEYLERGYEHVNIAPPRGV